MTDPISDMLTRIRNGLLVNKKDVIVPCSNLKKDISKVLVEEGYLHNVELLEDGIKKNLKVTLRYNSDGKKVITKIERVSKPSRRVYVNKDSIPRISGGMGITVLSTSKGIMTGANARSMGIGGEILCKVI